MYEPDISVSVVVEVGALNVISVPCPVVTPLHHLMQPLQLPLTLKLPRMVEGEIMQDCSEIATWLILRP